MSNRILSIPAGIAGFILAASSALAAGNSLPGDHGRPNDGIMPLNQPAPSGMPPATTHPALPRAPAIDFAVKAAESIATVCKQFPLGVSIVNTEGEPILIYIPNGTDPSHGYMALRKTFTAVTFKTPTSKLVSEAQQDRDFAAKIKANPNLIAYSGGILLKSGDELIGAIGVSGAEPGHHDENAHLRGWQRSGVTYSDE